VPLVSSDILNHDILPSTQFGSRPHHNAVDAVATLVHQIQATRAVNCAGALLLFDILGFFDNLNPKRTAQIFHDKGFPLGICQWVLQFMTNQKAILKIGDYMSKSFTITYGTPQGSPLSPILSALYTANLLHSAKSRNTAISRGKITWTLWLTVHARQFEGLASSVTPSAASTFSTGIKSTTR
jgi:hypothetical protein